MIVHTHAQKTLLLLLLIVSLAASAQTKRKSSVLPHISHANIIQGEIGKKIDAYLSSAEASGYSGIVLVAKDGKIILQKGYGFSDRDKGVSFTANTRFPLASVDKNFTAAAILKLEEMKKLKTTDSLPNFFDNVPADKRGITLHHLLTHSAGLPAYSGPDDELISRDTLVERMMKVKLRSVPGATFYYSNPSFSLLAVIVEKVSGQTFEAFSQEYVFKPAKMLHTNFTVKPEDHKNLPCSYAYSQAQCTPLDKANLLPDGGWSWIIRGNSGRWSTAGDLFRWHIALQENKVLSPASNGKSIIPHVKTTAGGLDGYGYGWFVNYTNRRTRLIHHSGGNQVVSTNMRRYIDEDAVIIEFTNNAWGPYRRVRDKIPEILFSEITSPPSPKIKLAKSELQQLEGTYRLPSGEEFEIAVKNNYLTVPLNSSQVAKAFTKFPVFDNLHLFEKPDNRIVQIIKGMAKNDFEPLRRYEFQDLKFEEEKQFWIDTWNGWVKKYGAFKSVGSFGTLGGYSSAYPKVSMMDTYVLVQFENGSEILNFQQNPDNYFYIIYGGTYVIPAYYNLVPESKNEFAIYNFFLQTHTRVNFIKGKGNNITLMVNSNKGEMAASKIR